MSIDDLARLESILSPLPHPLDLIEEFVTRFVAYPGEDARVAHVLWIVHTHAMDCWDSTPRIAFLSPEPGSGKTRALEITALLVPDAVQAVNVTPAYLFRRVSMNALPPTVLFDEIDTVFGPKVKLDKEDIRGFINAGHRRGAKFGRCVVTRGRITTEDLDAYCPLAVAGLGDLPDTVLTRSVVVRMRRRAPSQRVEPFSQRVHGEASIPIREQIEGWVQQVRPELAAARPTMPPGVADRDADVWEALLAVADAAAGTWPMRARAAACALVAESKQSTPSLGVRLLADTREIFGSERSLATADIINGLTALEEAPWRDLRGGKSIDARWLASQLRPYGIKSRNVREGSGAVLKGYAREELEDAWQRYLPAMPSQDATSATSATSATAPNPDCPISAAPAGDSAGRDGCTHRQESSPEIAQRM